MIVDVHSHLFFYENIDNKIKENEEKNVIAIIENGLNKITNRIVIEESEKYEIVYFALGYHPTDIVKEKDEEILKEIDFIRKLNHNKFLAIGEIGLDFYYIKNEEDRKKEIKYFNEFLSLAEEINKPVIIHSREAEKEVLEILDSYNVKVILHSFWKPSLVEKAIEKNYYLSIPSFVYRDRGLQKIAEKLPLELILTETDAPFLDPIEKRNNNSWKIIYGLEKIAEIKKVDIEELKRIILNNFKTVFNISL